MSIKRLIIPGIIGLSMLSTGISAAEPTHKSAPACVEAKGGCKHKSHMSVEQRAQVKKIMQAYRSKIRPLRQQARVLNLQIQGKLVTQGTHWKDIAMQNEQLNSLRGNIATLRLRARLEIFQKTGIVLPTKAKRGKYRHGQRRHRSH